MQSPMTLYQQQDDAEAKETIKSSTTPRGPNQTWMFIECRTTQIKSDVYVFLDQRKTVLGRVYSSVVLGESFLTKDDGRRDRQVIAKSSYVSDENCKTSIPQSYSLATIQHDNEQVVILRGEPGSRRGQELCW